MVLAYDEETGKQAYKSVVRLFRNESKEWYHVFADGEEIICTGGHPFYVVGKGFIEARKLKVSEKLLLSCGKEVIIEKVEVEQLTEAETTYNFEVADFHTYYVTEKAVLVHNMCQKNNSIELTDEELRNFGEPGKNSGFRVINGSHEDAMSFVHSQTNGLTEYAPGKYVGYNSRGVEFRIYARSTVPKPYTPYTSIRINGVSGLKGIKFIW